MALGASLEATHRALLGVGERLEVLCQALLEGHGGEPSWVLQRAYHQGPVAAHAPHRELGTVEAVGSPEQALHQDVDHGEAVQAEPGGLSAAPADHAPAAAGLLATEWEPATNGAGSGPVVEAEADSSTHLR